MYHWVMRPLINTMQSLLVHADKPVPCKNSYTIHHLHHETADEPLGRNNNAIVWSIVVN
jgi:hypothetical protein